jgi:hypothetical protein
MARPELLNDLQWQLVPQEIARLVKLAAGPYQVVVDLMPSLPDIGARVWYSPDKECAVLDYPTSSDSEKTASWHIALKQVPGIEEIVHTNTVPEDAPYIHIKRALDNASLFQPLASAAQFQPNALNNLWGGPNPLSATIGGGLLGAGLGYGGGWLAEQFLPEKYFEPGKLRRNTALIGGLAGMGPGLWHGFDQQFRGPEENRGPGAWIRTFPWHKESASRFTNIKTGLCKQLPDAAQALNELWEKSADEAGGAYAQTIPLDQFGRTIWNDLRSQGGYTSPQLAAATTGLLQAASLSQAGANTISPADIARIGIGMGSGYASGMFVGRTLGALAGLRPEAQEALQQAGIWAGVLTNTVPLLFRN